MTWFLVAVLTVVVLLALLAVIALAAGRDGDAEAERVRVEMEVRRAERRIHDIAKSSFQAMLDEARTHGRR